MADAAGLLAGIKEYIGELPSSLRVLVYRLRIELTKLHFPTNAVATNVVGPTLAPTQVYQNTGTTDMLVLLQKARTAAVTWAWVYDGKMDSSNAPKLLQDDSDNYLLLRPGERLWLHAPGAGNQIYWHAALIFSVGKAPMRIGDF